MRRAIVRVYISDAALTARHDFSVGAAAGCDLLTLIFESKIKRSQPAGFYVACVCRAYVMNRKKALTSFLAGPNF
jgi:hypothetical protein